MIKINKHLSRKNIIILSFITASIILAIFYVRIMLNVNSSVATLVLNIDNNNRKFEGEVIGGMTILDALITSANTGNIDLRYYVNENNEVYIMSFDGFSHIPGVREITFHVNEDRIHTKDINKIIISVGDEIRVGIE